MNTKVAFSLPGAVIGASPCLAGFDSDSVLDTATLQSYYAEGYRFCVRYLSLGEQSPGDLSKAEAARILEAGLALMSVQHVNAPGWTPNEHLGREHGLSAAANAQGVGFPAGVCVWLDLEGVSAGAPSTDVEAYCRAWFDVVAQAGYVPGLYVGASCGLSATQLSAQPFQHFWQSASGHLPEPARGYQMAQSLTNDLIDSDLVFDDRLGGRALWLALAAPSYPTLREDPARKSAAVKGLQTALNAAGATPQLAVDGHFGAATVAAVKAVQAAVGLEADGAATPQTWRAILVPPPARP